MGTREPEMRKGWGGQGRQGSQKGRRVQQGGWVDGCSLRPFALPVFRVVPRYGLGNHNMIQRGFSYVQFLIHRFNQLQIGNIQGD